MDHGPQDKAAKLNIIYIKRLELIEASNRPAIDTYLFVTQTECFCEIERKAQDHRRLVQMDPHVPTHKSPK